jgi:hypothetical protein
MRQLLASKVEKSNIVCNIVDTVRHASPKGGFVKMLNDGTYWEVGDRAAKERVGQTFRDMLHTKYSSSTKAKSQTRVKKMTLGFGAMISLSPRHDQSTNGSASDSSHDHSVENTTSETPLVKEVSLRDSVHECPLAFPTAEALADLRSSIRTIDPCSSFRGSIAGSLSSSSTGSLSGSSKDQQPQSSSDLLDIFTEPLPAYIGITFRGSMHSSPNSLRRVSSKMVASPRMSLCDATVRPFDSERCKGKSNDVCTIR